MFNITSQNIEWQNKQITLETGKIARQADASVLITMMNTRILCTVVGARQVKEETHFFPLTVTYLERYYASGRYPGGFIKRESKPTEREIIISRIIDRSIRPFFPRDYFHEVNVICTVLSYDPKTQIDILALLGTIAALNISSLPFINNLAAVKVSELDGALVINPSAEELLKSRLELIVTSTERAILMIELSANEVSKAELLHAMKIAHEQAIPLITLVRNFTQAVSKKNTQYKQLEINHLIEEINQKHHIYFVKAFSLKNRYKRAEMLEMICHDLENIYVTEKHIPKRTFDIVIKGIKKYFIRDMVIKSEVRVDGRKFTDIRNIACEIDLLPMTHGSSLFTRGETQTIGTVTLGSAIDQQMNDNMISTTTDRFLLHYNFPAYAVGECGIFKPPSRREFGHGKLAKKALEAVLPKQEHFPYTIRVVSDITESNGSSSMASVCAASLSLMCAGVPIKNAVVGIAMGLIANGDKNIILSDILSDEDESGDMDFKAAMSASGLTALQMDVKTVSGVTISTIEKVITQAQSGCRFILDKMNKVITEPRSTTSGSAPKVFTTSISQKKIKEVIGPGGRNIKNICEKSQAKIDINNTGKLTIFAPTNLSMKIARKMIDEIVAEPILGKTYTGKVIKIVKFAAFVRFAGTSEGLLHISEICDRRVDDIEDFLKVNDILLVKIIGLDKRGKCKLSIRNIEQCSELCSRKSWQQIRNSNDSLG